MQAAPKPVKAWCYTNGQQPAATVPTAELIELIKNGQLSPEHRIAPEGSEHWEPLGQSPFAAYLPKADKQPTTHLISPPVEPAPAPIRQTRPIPWRNVFVVLIAGVASGWWFPVLPLLEKLHFIATAQPSASALGPIVRYTFDGDKPEPGADLSLAPQQDGALHLNGHYEITQADGYRAVLDTPAMDYECFTVAVRLRVDDLNRGHQPLLVGGPAARWLVLHTAANGELCCHLNNHEFAHTLRGITLKANEWLSLVVTCDIAAQHLGLFLNGQSVGTIDPKDNPKAKVYFAVTARNDGRQDKKWTFTDYSKGTALLGQVDEFQLYNRILSNSEIATLKMGSNP